MERYNLYSIISLFIFLIFSACSVKNELPIYGNITPGTVITKHNDLKNLIHDKEITTLFIVTKDRTAVEISTEFIEDLKFITDEKNVWHSYSNTLPRTTNLKDIDFIAVDSAYNKYNLAFFTGNDIEEHLSPYQKIKKEFIIEGSSKLNNKFITKYTKDKSYNYSELNKTNTTAKDTLLIVYKSGKEEFIVHQKLLNDLHFNNTHWSLNHSPTDTLTIIWDKYPRDSIKDIYSKLKQIKKSNPILCIFVDGLGYNVLENAKAHDKAGYFIEFCFSPARTIYPPRTKYVYFSVGNPYNLNESKHEHKSIFSQLNLQKVFIVEEEKTYYPSKYPIILNTDKNNNGTMDDEIYNSALEIINKGKANPEDKPELLFVHFHSIDDTAHEYGPYSMQTLNQVEVVSDKVKNLVKYWEGDFIIFSDHGLHSTENGGTHGINKIEDMNAVVYYGFKKK